MKLTRFFEKIKGFFKNRRNVVLLSVNFGLIIFSLVFFGLFRWAGSTPNDQRAAIDWAGAGEERYAQISLFLGQNSSLSLETVMSTRQSIDKKLIESSIDSKNDSARTWIDAYSGAVNASVTANGISADVEASAVGGDFFFFHNYQLRAGQLFSEKDYYKDTVVIDTELAWRLYGALDVQGFEIEINGKTCYISGVIQRPRDFPDDKTYGEKSRIFIPFYLALDLNLSPSVSVYEMVLPNPVTGFAMGIAKDCISVPENQSHFVENSARYSVKNIFSQLKGFTDISMQTKAIAFPYYENAARSAEILALLFLLLAIIFVITPVVFAVIFIIRLWRKKGLAIDKVKNYIKARQLKKWNKKKIKKDQKEEEEVLI